MENPFDGISAVLFDMDGTLVQTEIDFGLMKREMLALAEKYGIPTHELANRDVLSIVDAVVAQLSESGRRDQADRARQEAFEKLEQIELAHSDNARPMRGAVELLDTLHRATIRFAIVTRNCASAVRLSMKLSGIHADVLLTRDDVPHTKPHPDHLLRALELLGETPANAMMVGDHWMDIQGGKAAGMRTVALLSPDKPAGYFDREKPDLIIHELSELTEHIERLDR